MADTHEPKRSHPGRHGVLQSYLNSIRRYQLLTNSGEHELATLSREGIESARRELIEGNLRIVVKLAMEYRQLGVPLEDLINEGNIGLMEAAARFDPSRGVRFVAYASWWVRKYIMAAVHRQFAENSSPVPGSTAVPPGEGTGGGPPDRLDAREPVAPRQRILSLEEFLQPREDSRAGDGGKAMTSADTSADEVVLEHQLAEAIRSILHHLPRLERKILEEHYGLNGQPSRTLQEIGRELGCTRERVRQHEARALQKAGRMLRAKKISPETI